VPPKKRTESLELDEYPNKLRESGEHHSSDLDLLDENLEKDLQKKKKIKIQT
jgi:hypothetical protein